MASSAAVRSESAMMTFAPEWEKAYWKSSETRR